MKKSTLLKTLARIVLLGMCLNAPLAVADSAGAGPKLPAGLSPAEWGQVKALMAKESAPRTAPIRAKSVSSLSQQAYVKASNTGGGDYFGYSVALSGDTLAVGAYKEASNATGTGGGGQDNDSATNAGAVYVFVRSNGVWTQQAYLKASNTEASDQFGTSVALAGDTLAVGATGEDSNATGIDGNQADNSAGDAGAVYVYTRSGTTWSQQAYVKASNPETNDFFGRSVALAGDTLAVGADGEDSNATGIGGDQADNLASSAGAVYVYTRSGTTWSQQAYVKASNSGGGDQFGRSVALAGDTLAVGAIQERSNAPGIDGDQANNSVDNAGAAYVYTRSGTTWSQQAYVKASNPGGGDYFGASVALAGDTLAVGAYGEASNGIDGNQANNSASNAGAAYVFAAPVAVNGACGSANGQSSAAAPSSNLCATGTATTVAGNAGNTAWVWGCNGSGGGTNTASDACSASYPKPTLTIGANPTSIIVGGTSTVTASSDNGLKPTLSNTTTSVCTLGTQSDTATGVQATATGNTVGTCTIKASQGANTTGTNRYLAADDKTVNINVSVPGPGGMGGMFGGTGGSGGSGGTAGTGGTGGAGGTAGAGGTGGSAGSGGAGGTAGAGGSGGSAGSGGAAGTGGAGGSTECVPGQNNVAACGSVSGTGGNAGKTATVTDANGGTVNVALTGDSGDAQIVYVRRVTNAGSPPSGLSFSNGVFDYRVTGLPANGSGSIQVKLTLPAGTAAPSAVYKCKERTDASPRCQAI